MPLLQVAAGARDSFAVTMAKGLQEGKESWALSLPLYSARSLYNDFCVSVIRDEEAYTAKVVRRGHENEGEG